MNQWAVAKDCIEEIDFQEQIFAVVNWPNSELYGAFVCIMDWPISEFYGASVCIMHYFDQSATNQLANVFLIAGVWVSVDFDSIYKDL